MAGNLRASEWLMKYLSARVGGQSACSGMDKFICYRSTPECMRLFPKLATYHNLRKKSLTPHTHQWAISSRQCQRAVYPVMNSKSGICPILCKLIRTPREVRNLFLNRGQPDSTGCATPKSSTQSFITCFYIWFSMNLTFRLNLTRCEIRQDGRSDIHQQQTISTEQWILKCGSNVKLFYTHTGFKWVIVWPTFKTWYNLLFKDKSWGRG